MDTQKTEKHNLNQLDIASVNQQLLQLAREVARDSLSQAQVQFGISEEFATKLRQMDLGAISRISSMPAMLFQPRLPDNLFEAAIAAADSDNQEALSLIGTSLTIR